MTEQQAIAEARAPGRYLREEFSAGLRASLEAAFEHEDMPIIRDVHRLMAGRDFWELKPIILTGESDDVRARRVLARLIAEEEEGTRIAAE
jgi:vanillate O-demethylase monooxygenase subunit